MAKILLEMKNITKTFPGVKALDNVNLQVEEGEIHALVGENGAGKSTLMKLLVDALRPTSGRKVHIDECIERYLSVWVLRRGHHL